jgi:hypothetical protein
MAVRGSYDSVSTAVSTSTEHNYIACILSNVMHRDFGWEESNILNHSSITQAKAGTTTVTVTVTVTLRLTVGQSVSTSWCRAHFGTSDQSLLL